MKSCAGVLYPCNFLGAPPKSNTAALQVMDETRAAGLSVLRTWAFCDGAEWNALQPAPGKWDERVFGALDWVVAQAGARGLRLIFALTKYWAAYAGIKQYVRRAHALIKDSVYGRQESSWPARVRSGSSSRSPTTGQPMAASSSM